MLVTTCAWMRGSEGAKATVYYLCIGSVHYEHDFEKYAIGFNGLLNLEAAGTSAIKMKELLEGFGAESGEVVISQKDAFIDSAKIYNALHRLINRVKKEKKQNPFVVFYYAGHGYSSPQVEGMFLPPGSFVENPSKLDLDGWIKHAISPLDIHEKLQQAKLHHMLLLDCCYEGRQQPDAMLEKQVVKNLGIEKIETLMTDLYGLLRAMNRMIGPDPVIFSAPVDMSVPTVPLPDGSGEYVGPLCRKAYIVKQKTDGKPLSVQSFTELMTMKGLDTLTIDAVTHASFDATGARIFKQQ